MKGAPHGGELQLILTHIAVSKAWGAAGRWGRRLGEAAPSAPRPTWPPSAAPVLSALPLALRGSCISPALELIRFHSSHRASTRMQPRLGGLSAESGMSQITTTRRTCTYDAFDKARSVTELTGCCSCSAAPVL